MHLRYNYIVGIKEWFLKKIKKRPLTEDDKTIRVSTSKTGYKKKKPKDILSEEHTMTSHQNTSAISKLEQQSSNTATKGEEDVVQVNSTQNEFSKSLQTTDKIRTSVETKTASSQRLSLEAIHLPVLISNCHVKQDICVNFFRCEFGAVVIVSRQLLTFTRKVKLLTISSINRRNIRCSME
jgi:hypothetical protein